MSGQFRPIEPVQKSVPNCLACEMSSYHCFGRLTNESACSRDVKTVYFSEPVTGLPKPVFYRLLVTERPIVSGITVTGRSTLAISLSVDHLLLHGGRGPRTRRTDAVAAGQRTVAYQSGRGQREQMLCRRELITIVTPQCKNGRFSLPLQCI